jgi:hypothetical protein
MQILLSFSILFKNVKIKLQSTVILPLLMYGYETWSLTLREEHRMWMLENRVLRKTLGPKRGEVTGVEKTI